MATTGDEKAAMRADFERLQREYRNMEAMRKAYSEESLGIIKRQREMIEKFQTDNDTLKAELDLEMRYAQKKTVSDSTLTGLHDQIDSYTHRVEVERRNIEQLQKQAQVMKGKILEKRRNMGGVNAAKENQHMIQKQIRILENRLDKALVKFNEALAHNKELRMQIDNLRRERFMFDKIYKKLERELHEKKKQMANIIELSNQAYEARDGAQMEIAAVQQQMGRERAEYEEQMAEYNRILEERSRERAADPEGRGAMTVDEESRLKSDMHKGAWNMAKDKAAVQVSIDKVQSYEEAFNKIHAATGIDDIEELVSTFIANEDQNFSLFNYVSEQNNEIERLEEQIAGLKEELVKHQAESGDDDNLHKQLLKDLEERLHATEESGEKYEMRFQEASKTVNSLKVGIQSIFTKIECNTMLMSEMLADSQVTENNIMQFLGMIEQRTNEVLHMFAQVQSKKAALKEGRIETDRGEEARQLVSILGHGPTTQHGGAPLRVDPPKLDDYSSDEDESEDEAEARPLSMKELKDKTMKSIAMKSHGGKGRAGGGRRAR
mmetsp:Transcript_11365/g.39630  ORF Transcript_11365/g.39630 Transcript_11365/m.39630 type:complete len:550 (-) Transcript_11365:22-1671(-)